MIYSLKIVGFYVYSVVEYLLQGLLRIYTPKYFFIHSEQRCFLWLFTILFSILDDQSLISAEAVLAPPQMTGDQQAYIPIDHAKDCIQKVNSYSNYS